jgi:hypothetical protein
VASAHPDQCGHNGLLTFEWEGWEDPTEPLQILVNCSDCEGWLRVVVEDANLRRWVKYEDV